MARIYLETYGCTLNQADSDIISALLIGSGHRLVDREEDSDVVILNTCTVKGATENKIFERMRSLAKDGRKFVVAGCLSANEKKIKKYAPLAPIVGPSSLAKINDAISDALANRPTIYKKPESKDQLPKLLTSPIARIPIGEGCVSACHFCQTRIARPYLKSYSPKTIVKWINKSIEAGAKEIQLTAMDAGAYGLDIKTNLERLLDAIANDDSSSRPREANEYFIRLGMINPDHCKRMLPGIINALKHPRFYHFIHVPVQTGSEKVCKEMNRDHTVKDFIDIVQEIRSAVPDVMIATDIIVGYPTETEEDFQQTLSLLQSIKPETVNLSKFCPRPFTKAKELKQLPGKEIKRRSGVAAKLIREIGAGARKRFIGQKLRVLITEKDRDFKGRSIGYQQVVVKGFAGKLGDIVDVKIKDANHGSLFGQQIE